VDNGNAGGKLFFLFFSFHQAHERIKTLFTEKQLPTTWKIKSPAKIAGAKQKKRLLNVVVLSVKNNIM
jgi:hypothetical protein